LSISVILTDWKAEVHDVDSVPFIAYLFDAAAQPTGESVEKDSPLIGASVRKIGSLGSGQADVTRGGRRLLL
jgi:hypothetical protein